jgi:RNA polymerase sigma-70 factor (ECF subfamily)
VTQKAPPQPTDEELVARLASDASALGDLYDRHARLVYGLALAILTNADEAADLTQEVFLSLCGSSLYDPARGTVGAFLTTLVRTRRVRLLRAQWENAPPPERPSLPHDRVAEAEHAKRVRDALAALPDTERRALEMAYYRGLTQAEIAEDLAVPLGTVKSWCRRGLLTMRRALADLVDG